VLEAALVPALVLVPEPVLERVPAVGRLRVPEPQGQ